MKMDDPFAALCGIAAAFATVAALAQPSFPKDPRPPLPPDPLGGSLGTFDNPRAGKTIVLPVGKSSLAAGEVRKAIAAGTTSVQFMYDETGKLLGEYLADGSTARLIAEYVYLGDLLVAVIKPRPGSDGSGRPGNVDVFYVHTDHLGTPRAITRPSDNKVVWRWDNKEPFGNNPPDENPSGLGVFKFNLRHPGQYYDEETGTLYNYFRDYDPATGRYRQSDPVGLKAGASTYAYTRGDPLKNKDPYGLWGMTVHHQMIGDSFRGLDSVLLRAIKNGSDNVDSIFNQFGDTNYMHAMRRDGETPETARGRTCAYIREKMRKFRLFNAIPAFREHAYFYLGQALHPVMDSTSPVHQGWQVWLPAEDWRRHGDDNGSEEGVGSLTPALLMQTRKLIQDVLTGKECSCTEQ